MLRQRIRTRASSLTWVGWALLTMFALALIWYGLMVVLLAAKVSPSTVNSISGYRTAYDFLSGLQPTDLTSTTRAIIAGSGLLALLFFGYALLKQFPRPYRARHELDLERDEHGEVTVEPRAIERLAEAAASEQPGVASARGLYGTDSLGVNVSVSRPREVADTLTGVQTRVAEALEQHDLPTVPVNVTLVGFDS